MTRTIPISVITCILALAFAAEGEVARFIRTVPRANQPVVTDSVTDLVWQGCSAGLSGSDCTSGESSRMIWQDALSYCERLDWGGSTDWRLPNVIELTSIVDESRTYPSIDRVAFPATLASGHWSSSSYAGDSSVAWSVVFDVGYVFYDDKSYAGYVRCVRGGP